VLLRLEQSDLAHRVGVSVATIRRLEGAGGSERVAAATFGGVRQALEESGAEFIPDGVRRRRAVVPVSRLLYDDLRAISLRSAARLRDLVTDADLYDDDGLPA
jgi:transcriptional regulator with XRE-family HTH domain